MLHYQDVFVPSEALQVLTLKQMQTVLGRFTGYTAEQVASLFTEDATLDVEYWRTWKLTGRDEIQRWVQQVIPAFQRSARRQRSVNTLVDLHGDTAQVQSIIVVDQLPGRRIGRQWGRCTHQAVRRSEGWRFTASHIHMQFSTSWGGWSTDPVPDSVVDVL